MPKYGPPAGSSSGIHDPKLQVQQSYTVTREKLKHGKTVSEKVIGRGIPVAPNNVGPKTIPNYEPVWLGAVSPLSGGGKTFVGPADDAFFVDLGAIFDGINIDKPGRPAIGLGNQGGGKDDVSG